MFLGGKLCESGSVGSIDAVVMVVNHAAADPAFGFGMGVRGEGGGPGDVAVAAGVEGVAAFGEDPAGAGVLFTKSEVVGGDVGMIFGEMLFGVGKLIHERYAEVLLFGGEVDFHELAGELGGGFPTDLAAETGFVAGGLNVFEVAQEKEKNGF